MPSSKEEIRPLLKLWAGLYNAAPKLYIPGTKFDVAFTILAVLFMTFLRFINTYLYLDILNFDPSNPRTKYAIVCTSSAMHSLMLVPSLWSVLRDQPYKPSASIASAPKYYQATVTALLQLCTGYMIYDFIFMIRDNGWALHPDDIPFAAHHFVTVLYMSQTRVLGAGHISAMTLMWSGEFSNPLQNAHNVSRFAIQMMPLDTFWHAMHPYVELTFACVYCFMRAVVGPLQIIHITYDLLTKEGRKNIPWWTIVLWIIMIWGIILGSIPWTIESYDMVMDGLDVKYTKDWDYGPRFEF